MASRMKISSGAGSDAAKELCRVRILAGRPLSRRMKSDGTKSETGFPAASATTRSMLKRPSRTTGSVVLSGANGFCATDCSRKGGVCPPAPQVPRIMMPAIKAVRCGLDRFITTPHVLGGPRRAQPARLLPCLQQVRVALRRQNHTCDPPVNTDGFRPLPVSSQADSISNSNHR